MFDLKCIKFQFLLLKDCFFHINNIAVVFSSSHDKASGRILLYHTITLGVLGDWNGRLDPGVTYNLCRLKCINIRLMGRIESLYCYLKDKNLGCYNWSITRLEMAFFILLKVESAKEMTFRIHMITLGDNMKNLRWIKKILFSL